MDENRIFAVLGIDITRDEEEIRGAYRGLLRQVNPEDDPEGFKRLREAYEAALRYAQTPEEEERQPVDDSPVGRWMEQVRAVYSSLPRRLDGSEWEKLLKEDVCVALDYSEEIRWRLFRYLAEHYQLPSYIFRILDKEFHIERDAAVYKEHLPVNFVEYLLRKVRDTEGATDFDYAGFRGKEDADYDGFMRMFHELQVHVDNEDGKAAMQTVQAMDRYGISHPLYELLKAFTCLLLEQYEEALALIRPLMEAHPDTDRIQVQGGEILYRCGLHQEAMEKLEPYRERNYYQVEKYLCLCQEENGNLKDAIFHCQRAMRDGRGVELRECMQRLYDKYLEEFVQKEREDYLDEDDVNCYVSVLERSGRAQEALDYLERNPERAERMEDIHHCRMVLYLQLKRYEDVLEEGRLWTEELVSSGEMHTQKGEQQALATIYLTGEALYRMGMAGDREAGEKALEMYRQASQSDPGNQDYRQRILELTVELGNYEEAVRLADELIASGIRQYPAYVQKQMACFELGRAQEVVDCFYAARRIHAGEAAIYEKAADIFIRYRQYADAESIFRMAQEDGADSIGLSILKLRCLSRKEERSLSELRQQGRMGEFRLDKDLTALIKSVKAKYRENPEPAAYMCLLFEELGLVERNRRHFKEAAGYFRRAIKYEERPYCHYLLANALFDADEYEKALKEYHTYEKIETEKMESLSENFYINAARCSRSAEKREEAIEYFKKALALNPENREANGAIANLYRNMMWDSGNKYYGRLAMPYSDRQIELTPDSAFYLRRRGWLLRDMGEYEEALKAFERSLELEESQFSYNGKGKTLNNLRRHEEALDCLRKAIELGGSRTDSGVYWEGGNCLCSMGRYAEAQEWLLRGIELHRKDPDKSLYSQLDWMFRKIGEFEKAREICRQGWEDGVFDEEDYETDCLVLDQLLGIQGEFSYVERAVKLTEKYDSVTAWWTLAECYEHGPEDMEAALAAALKALEKARENGKVWDNRDLLLVLMRYYVMLKDRENAARYAEMFYHELEKTYSYNREQSAAAQYLDDIHGWSENACNLAQCEIARGNLDEAERYLQWIKSKPLCAKCSHSACVEMFELQGYLCEVRGEREQALENYRRAQELYRGSLLRRYRIQVLERR